MWEEQMPDEITRSPVDTVPALDEPTNKAGSDTSTISPASVQDLKAKVGADISAATEAIRDGASSAMEKVQDTVVERSNFAARQVGGIASALQKVGAELANSDQREVGRYAKEIGDGVQSFARKIEGRNFGQIVGMAEEFGRKQPLAFLGVAALAGLAASRFLTASAKRSSSSAANEQTGANASQGMAPSPLSGGRYNG
jgi:ElaB/YqjD/DUF883 family membrane-anchored ribosome-binding protein